MIDLQCIIPEEIGQTQLCNQATQITLYPEKIKFNKFSNAHYKQFKINKNVSTEQFAMKIKCLQRVKYSKSTYT